VRNEALDARAMALAALHGLYMAGVKLNDQCDRFKAMLTGEPVQAAGYQLYRSRFISAKDGERCSKAPTRFRKRE
jgi:hypothetical protein